MISRVLLSAWMTSSLVGPMLRNTSRTWALFCNACRIRDWDANWRSVYLPNLQWNTLGTGCHVVALQGGRKLMLYSRRLPLLMYPACPHPGISAIQRQVHLQPFYTLRTPTPIISQGQTYKWGAEEQGAFQLLKDGLCTEEVLAHFDPSLEIGILCDASLAGVGTVLFHRYPDGGERPTANASETLTETQRNYSQIQRETLAVVFALKMFYQFLYGRRFILVTNHKPLVSMFGHIRKVSLRWLQISWPEWALYT